MPMVYKPSLREVSYTAGPVTFISDPTPAELLAEYFAFTDTGLTVTGAPTQAHFDLCALQLAANLDKLRWQIGAWANEYRRRFGGNAYERAVAVSGFSVKSETIEQWAYVERNVPPDNRRAELSLWYHRIVAKLPPVAQPEALEYCIKKGLGYSKFFNYVANLGCSEGTEALSPRPGNSDDKKLELTQELYNLEIKYQEKEVELKRYSAKTIQLENTVTGIEERLRKAESGLVDVFILLASSG